MGNMKILIIYFSRTGRTKKVAEVIATELKDHNVDIEPITYTGEGKYRFMEEDKKLKAGDMSSFNFADKILEPKSYDLILFGVPTWGSTPTPIFEGYIQNCNITEKEFVIFNTCRFLSGGCLKKMQKAIEEKGGKVLEKKTFKALFSIGEKKAKEFGKQINQIKT